MSIVSFWSNGNEETGKTLAIAAIATNMAIEHNYKILLLSTDYADETLEECFWEKEKTKKSLIELAPPSSVVEIDNGIEGIAKAIKANKLTPDVISSYTKVVFKDRLDILPTIKSGSYDEYERLKEVYADILKAANQFYDIILVDLSKGLDKEFVKQILISSDLVITTFSQRKKIIDNVIELREKEKMFLRSNNMYLIGRYDVFSKYNIKNVSRYMGLKEEAIAISYNTLFFEACCEGKIVDYFLRFRTTVDEFDKNTEFIKAVSKATERIDYKLQELRLKM